MTNILEIFQYSFMMRALITGILLALTSSLIGVTLVLKKNSMIGDGLSHVGFGAFALATILNTSPLEFSLPIVIITFTSISVPPCYSAAFGIPFGILTAPQSLTAILPEHL